MLNSIQLRCLFLLALLPSLGCVTEPEPVTTIEGTVLSEDGHPVPAGVSVDVFWGNSNFGGWPTPQLVGSTTTGPRGEFSVRAGTPAGRTRPTCGGLFMKAEHEGRVGHYGLYTHDKCGAAGHGYVDSFSYIIVRIGESR